MAYMHKETFKIYSENSVTNPVDYFEVDDLIALPIQTLNHKGYITESCCSGHPFLYLIDARIILPDLSSSVMYGSEDSPLKKPCRSFILFKEGIYLKKLPPEFNIDKTKDNETLIEKYYNDNGVYEYEIVRNILNAMEQLYEWALNLPDYKD